MRGFLVVALAVLLAWQGLALLPVDAGGDVELEDAEEAEAAERDAGEVRGEEEDLEAGGEENPEPDPGGEPAQGEPAQGERLQALRELIGEAVATGRLGDGYGALQDLEEMEPVEGWETSSAEGREALGNALTDRVLRLREALGVGNVLGAWDLVAAMRGTPHPAVLQALNTMAEGEGWPSLGEGPVLGLDIPEPMALARERSVRVEWHDEVLVGTVAEDEGRSRSPGRSRRPRP